MSKLNEIFQKRLERIRDELNIYIDSYLTLSEPKLSVPPKKVTMRPLFRVTICIIKFSCNSMKE